MLTEIAIAFIGAIIAVAAALLGQATGRRRGRTEGYDEAIDDMDRADRANADEIRSRVQRDRDGRLHEYSDRGFRD